MLPTNLVTIFRAGYSISIVLCLVTQITFGQKKKNTNRHEIHKVLTTFMECLVQKDSTKFYALFHTDPVVWTGVVHQKTHADELKKDPAAKDNFRADYKSFYRHFYTKQIKEEFYNIRILENGYIAAVLFDYSFWENEKKTNWGKESWALIKTNNQWKITSVIFSTEDETILPEPIIKKNKSQIEE